MPDLENPGRRPGRRRLRSDPASRAGNGTEKRLTAADIMSRKVVVVHPDTTVGKVSDLFQAHNIHGAPVVDDSGALVGIISEDDLVFGPMGFSDAELARRAGDEKPPPAGSAATRPVRELMTHHPLTISETTPVEEICRIITRLRIHRLPVTSGGRVTGIVSSVDICRLIAEGTARLERA
ncbi:MAG: HPP family protein [Acidobacteriota bacterium]